MTLFLLVLLAAALAAPHLVLTLARRQRANALARFGQRVTARRAQIQADLSRVASDPAARGFDRLRLISGLNLERSALDLYVHRVQVGEHHPDAPLPTRPQHQWRPLPTDTVLACSTDTVLTCSPDIMRECEPLETACRAVAGDMAGEPS